MYLCIFQFDHECVQKLQRVLVLTQLQQCTLESLPALINDLGGIDFVASDLSYTVGLAAV